MIDMRILITDCDIISPLSLCTTKRSSFTSRACHMIRWQMIIIFAFLPVVKLWLRLASSSWPDLIEEARGWSLDYSCLLLLPTSSLLHLSDSFGSNFVLLSFALSSLRRSVGGCSIHPSERIQKGRLVFPSLAHRYYLHHPHQILLPLHFQLRRTPLWSIRHCPLDSLTKVWSNPHIFQHNFHLSVLLDRHTLPNQWTKGFILMRTIGFRNTKRRYLFSTRWCKKHTTEATILFLFQPQLLLCFILIDLKILNILKGRRVHVDELWDWNRVLLVIALWELFRRVAIIKRGGQE